MSFDCWNGLWNLTLSNVCLLTSNLSWGSHCILRKFNCSALLNLPKSAVVFAYVLFGTAWTEAIVSESSIFFHWRLHIRELSWGILKDMVGDVDHKSMKWFNILGFLNGKMSPRLLTVPDPDQTWYLSPFRSVLVDALTQQLSKRILLSPDAFPVLGLF